MPDPYETLASLIVSRPKMVAVIFCMLLATAFVGMSFISMATGIDTYVDKDTRRGMLLDKYLDTFQSDNLMILIETDDVLDPVVLEYIDRLERDVVQERYVRGASGITDLVKGQNGGVLPGSTAGISRIREGIPPELLALYVPSGTMSIMVVNVDQGLGDEQGFTLVENVEKRVALSHPPPGVSVIVTGNQAYSKEMSDEMGSSMGTLIMVAMVLMVIAVGLLFGHVRYRLLPVFIVGTGLIFTFGVIGFSGMPITMVTIGAFPVMIGIGIDYAIQFHSRFDEEVQKSPIHNAVTTTITKTGPSVLYAMLATAMGFLALSISPLPMIRSFGITCVIGICCCYLSAIVVVPVFGILVQYRPVTEAVTKHRTGELSNVERFNRLVGSVVKTVSRHPVPVLAACILIAAAGFQLDNEIIVNTDEKTFVPPDMPAKVNLDKVRRTMGETSGIPIYVQGSDLVSPDVIRWMAGFQEYEAMHNSKITGSASIATYVLQYNNNTLPETDYELTRVMEKIPRQIRDRYVSGNGVAVIEFTLVSMPNDVAMSMIERMEKDLDWYEPPPGVYASITGTGEMFTNLIREIREGKTRMTILGFAMILAFLYLVYRKFVKAATPLVPIIMIVGWNGLIMFLLAIDYTPLTATLGSMSVGVASEYTILIMERYYEERENGLPLLEAIQYSIQRIGTAITVSGMTTVFGFAALMVSAFGIISNFGTVTVISVFFALAGAIIVMPAILVLVGRMEDRQAGNAQQAGTSCR
ncbi:MULTISPECIES: RND family transporter [unclassified Methanoregula]|uniref:efflux RND transporter permease subunit n=1 Tax=unclassified Methanoregula TaxID=2649730 RepID=UPI0009CD214F|nr:MULTISPECIES: RND family transporter [unclassified Methanoregula]OPX62633.1 MAG: bifunctional preprotein translocase subunit SecD/SecF [Methanoregula sp. PtaB.Bin085]OPY33008.1 MAG: bifunctional preprotein translocase subunit SecD/SecF [Methanoregula sp. PtaU1.Bin006]